MGFHRIPSLRLGNQIGSIFCRFTPPENPLFSGFFHVPEIVHFVNLTSKSHRNDVKFDVKNDVRIPGENHQLIKHLPLCHIQIPKLHMFIDYIRKVC